MEEEINIQNIAKKKKKEIESKLEKRIKEMYPNFDIEVFSNNKSDSVITKQNNINDYNPWFVLDFILKK